MAIQANHSPLGALRRENRWHQRKARQISHDGPRDSTHQQRDKGRPWQHSIPSAQSPKSPDREQREPHEKEDVVDRRRREVSVQEIMCHPEAATERAVPTRDEFEGACGEQEPRTMRIRDADVGQCGHGCRPRACGRIDPGTPDTAERRLHHDARMPEASRPQGSQVGPDAPSGRGGPAPHEWGSPIPADETTQWGDWRSSVINALL